MNFSDIIWDKKLKIDTEGRDESRSDEHHKPYQPTYYAVLERLRETGYISKDSVILDYGCGKGRVLLFFYYVYHCKCIGIEREDIFYKAALKNIRSFVDAKRLKPNDINIINNDAEKVAVTFDVNTFFFFNPFSVQILKGVMKRIMESYYECPRRMTFIFYYLMPETDYYLSGIPELELQETIDCHDLLKSRDKKHIIKIYTIN